MKGNNTKESVLPQLSMIVPLTLKFPGSTIQRDVVYRGMPKGTSWAEAPLNSEAHTLSHC